jgi:NADH-quinone oxidoreductase subunit N
LSASNVVLLVSFFTVMPGQQREARLRAGRPGHPLFLAAGDKDVDGRVKPGVDDWAGLGGRHGGAALAMTICLLSLGGMPPTNGFFGKFYIFKSAMEVSDGQLLWLVVIGVINSAISIYYYLRIVTAMYFREASQPFSPTRSSGLLFVMVACPLLILEMGVMPGWWLKLVGG